MAYIDTSKVTIPKGFFEDLTVPKLLNWLNSQPTADVAPKSEVAKEIFEEIERLIKLYTVNTPLYMPFSYIDVLFVHFVAELKKKYTEE